MTCIICYDQILLTNIMTSYILILFCNEFQKHLLLLGKLLDGRLECVILMCRSESVTCISMHVVDLSLLLGLLEIFMYSLAIARLLGVQCFMMGLSLRWKLGKEKPWSPHWLHILMPWLEKVFMVGPLEMNMTCYMENPVGFLEKLWTIIDVFFQITSIYYNYLRWFVLTKV